MKINFYSNKFKNNFYFNFYLLLFLKYMNNRIIIIFEKIILIFYDFIEKYLKKCFFAVNTSNYNPTN